MRRRSAAINSATAAVPSGVLLLLLVLATPSVGFIAGCRKPPAPSAFASDAAPTRAEENSAATSSNVATKEKPAGKGGVSPFIAAPPSPSSSPAATVAAARPFHRLPKIDIHMHIGPDGIERAVALMNKWGITGGANLSGMYPGPPRHMLESQVEAAAETRGRLAVFANANFRRVTKDRDYGKAMAADLVASKKAGAVGLKIPKGLGLGYPAPDGKHLLTVDDRGLDPLFEKAGQLGMPVAIHVGDPKAFWKPATPDNERWDELGAHPDWSFYDQPVPSWEELYAAFERRVARHPKTMFIAVHFGNDPEDPARVAQMLEKYANFYIDTAARVPEIGRHDAAKMRAFFEKYQDRILFGTDTGVGASQDDMMYGSNGPDAPTLADEDRFFAATWRYFETNDKQFESPTPIQGRWKIDGIGLPENILRKVYFENAARLLRWKPALPAVEGDGGSGGGRPGGGGG